MLGVLLLVAMLVESNGQGYLGFPEGCNRDSCSAYVQWSLVDSDTILFELEASSPGWVAVGVSADQVMGGDGIDDVFACQRDATDDTVYAEDTHNPEDQSSHRSNILDSNQNGFERISSSYDNGRISCTFTRGVLADSVSEDRNLNESSYLLLATGSQRAAIGSSNITLGYHGYNNKWPSSDLVTLTAKVPLPNISSPAWLGTLGFPDGCQRASCNAYVQWALGSDDTVQFELEGETEGWVAVGVSADQVMGGDGIDDVFACQRDASADDVYAQDTYNPEDQSSHRSNDRDSDQNGFHMTASSYDNGRITCSFSRSVLAENLNEDRNLNESAYLLLAVGSQRAKNGSTDVTLGYHGYMNKWPSAAKVTLTQSTPTATPSSSPPPTSPTPHSPTPHSPTPTGKGEFSTPGCEGASCLAYVQWTLATSDTLQFKLEGKAEGWVAVGVSADKVMGGDGIDDVFACQRDATDDAVYAQDMYNPQDQSTRGNKRDSNQIGFKMTASSYDNGRITCTFTRSVLAENLNEDRNLNESAYLLLAAGSATGGPDVVLDFHDVVWLSSNAPVILTSGQSAAAVCETDPLMRAHGILMYIAWIWLAPIAYFFAAYMKPAMPGGAWFQVHRALMLIALAFSVAGFILIFVALRNSGNPNGLITLGKKHPIHTTHFVFGWVIITLQILNPIISIFRCKPDSIYRWIFNLIHGSMVGWVAIVLAIINVGIGIWMYSPWAFGRGNVSHYYPFWVWIASSIVQFSFIAIYNKWIPPERPCLVKKLKKEEQVELKEKPTFEEKEEFKEVSPVEEDPPRKSATEDKPPKVPSEDALLRYGFMVFNIALHFIPGVVVIVLLGYGCI